MEKKSSRPKKSLGQHFLMHPATAERIADAAQLLPADVVFEIGPGKGALTRALLSRARKVIALEADIELAAYLREAFAEETASGHLELVEGDVRAFDPAILPEKYVLVANIPYYLTGEIFRKFLTSSRQPRALTFLIQKEVAVRIAREKKGSLLSLSVQAYGIPVYEFTVPKGAFVPPPKVDSAVLSVRGISRGNFATPAEEERFFALLHAGFAHKRKRLQKNLEEAGYENLAIPQNARAEDLSLANWLTLAKTILR